MYTIRERDLDARFTVLQSFGVPWTHLEHGSPTYGRTWQVYTRGENGCHMHVRHIGCSRREAMAWLDGAIAGAARRDDGEVRR